MSKPGVLYLIPTYLSEHNDAQFLAPIVLEVLQNTSYFVVENIRTARRYISSLKLGLQIEDLKFEVLNKNSTITDIEKLLYPLKEGHDIGVISESGLPCLADPGNLAVSYAHQNNLTVCPLPGASSIQSALIASGLNGQQFTFHGYLPVDKTTRKQAILTLEQQVQRTGYSQIFMETPYRNEALFQDIVKICHPLTILSISRDLFGSQEKSISLPISSWKNTPLDLHKIPAVFILGHYPD